MKLRHIASVLCAVLASCSANAPTNGVSCTPGATVACPCANGTFGAQVCNPGGTFDACRCIGLDAGFPPGLDASALDVAPTDGPLPDAPHPDAPVEDAGFPPGLDASAPDVAPTDRPLPDAPPLDAPVRDAGYPDAPPDGGDAGPACTGVSLATDGVLDLDVRAAHVRGAVTFNGAPAPATFLRGTVTFARREGGSVTSTLAASGPAVYDLLLAPGTYDISYGPVTSDCSSLPAPIPCAGTTVREGVAVTADGVLDLDVQSVLVRGTVTLNGGPSRTRP